MSSNTLTGPVSIVFFDKKADPANRSAWCIRTAGQVPPKNHYPVAIVSPRETTIINTSLPIDDEVLVEARRQAEFIEARDIGGDLDSLYPEWSKRDLNLLADMLVTRPHGGTEEQIHIAARAAHRLLGTALWRSSRNDPKVFGSLINQGVLLLGSSLRTPATFTRSAAALRSPHDSTFELFEMFEKHLVSEWMKSLTDTELTELGDELFWGNPELVHSDQERARLLHWSIEVGAMKAALKS